MQCTPVVYLPESVCVCVFPALTVASSLHTAYTLTQPVPGTSTHSVSAERTDPQHCRNISLYIFTHTHEHSRLKVRLSFLQLMLCFSTTPTGAQSEACSHSVHVSIARDMQKQKKRGGGHKWRHDEDEQHCIQMDPSKNGKN